MFETEGLGGKRKKGWCAMFAAARSFVALGAPHVGLAIPENSVILDDPFNFQTRLCTQFRKWPCDSGYSV